MDWITANGETVGVTVLLMFTVWARYKGYWVDQGTHQDVVKQRDDAVEELRKQDTTLADMWSYIKRAMPVPPEERRP